MNIFKSQNTSADFDKLYKTGFELFEHYQYEEAVEAFSSAANLNPNDTRPLEMLAATYGNLRR
jgi:Flp pilus assembly protein TadD